MNKKILMFSFLGLLMIGLGAAALVNYWGQQQMNIEVTEAITLDNNVCDFTTVAGDGYELCLVSGQNNLEDTVSTVVSINLLKYDGTDYVEVTDTEGFYIAFTEDSAYAYDPAHGDVDNWADAQTWMIANPDWLDWNVDTDVSNYDNTLVTTAKSTLFEFVNTEFPQDISPLDEFYVGFYIGTDVALDGGNYRLVTEFSPTA